MAKKDNAVAQAKHEIELAKQDAKKDIANAVAEALKVTSVKSSEDHDLLIRIATQVEQVIKDVADIKTNTVARIDKLETDYVTKAEHEKVTDRIDKMEGWRNWVLGVGLVAGGLMSFLAVALFNHLIAK